MNEKKAEMEELEKKEMEEAKEILTAIAGDTF